MKISRLDHLVFTVKDIRPPLFFILRHSFDQAIEDLNLQGIILIEGPVERTGAIGKIRSIYFRDPNNNLIEVSEYMSRQPEDA